MLISLRGREPDETASKIESDRWTVSMATYHTAYPDTKLKTDNINDYARAWGQRMSHSTITAIFEDFSRGTPVDYVAVLGINRDLPRNPVDASLTFLPNEARVIVDQYPEAHQPPVFNSGFSLTNLTGSYTVLNQILHPPEETLVGGYTPTALTAINQGLDTAATFLFDNSPARPIVGEQAIYVHVRDSVDVDTWPTISATLRQSGADIELLTIDEVQATSHGYIYKFTWDGAVLPDNNEFVGLRINGETTTTSTVEIMGVMWRAGVSGTLYDSGFQPITKPYQVVWTPNVTTPIGRFGVIVQFSDFGYLTPDTTVDPLFPVNTKSFFRFTPYNEAFHAGRFVAGEALRVPLREIGGFNLRKSGNNQNSLIISRGGYLRAQRNDLTRWEADINIIPQGQSRLFDELDTFFTDVGFTVPSLYIADDDDGTTALWAVITSWEAVDSGALVGKDHSAAAETTESRYGVQVVVIEASARQAR